MTLEERNDWIVQNLGLIRFFLRDFRTYGNYEDIIQEGTIGAMVALDRMEGEVKKEYVRKYVIGYVRHSFGAIVHVPKHININIEVLSLNYDYDSDRNAADYLVSGYERYNDVITKVDFENALKHLKPNKREIAEMYSKGFT